MTTSDEDGAGKRQRVIGRMVAALKRGEPRSYFVGLVGYYIEGIPYSASGLSIDSSGTPDLVQTATGFRCTAFFPPESIQLSTVRKNGIIEQQFGGELRETVKVTIEVKSGDIWSVAEFIDGTQHDLFLDPETYVSRKSQFMIEMQQWFDTQR